MPRIVSICSIDRVACLLAALAALSSSWAFGACAELDSTDTAIEMNSGTDYELRLPAKIERLAVGDPAVADIQLTSAQSVLITGKVGGTTNISIWTTCGVRPVQRMVFVTGQATAALEPRAVNARSNLPDQVQTDIRFVEVNRNKLKEMGVSLFVNGSSNALLASPGISPASVAVGGVGDLAPGAPFSLSDSGFNILWGGGSDKVLGALNALESSGFAYTLARPSLVALSGQSASFLAGGEYPVPVPSTSSDSISIEYKEYGVRLSLTPTVINENRIVLKVAPEVSELDFTTGVTIAGTVVPALNVRRTDTSVSLGSGDSFVISGLISTRNASSVGKLPLLGDMPVLGALFRSSSIERQERELLMIVTPHLVRPMVAGSDEPELPGERLRNYAPSASELLLFESGNFDLPQGLSQ